MFFLQKALSSKSCCCYSQVWSKKYDIMSHCGRSISMPLCHHSFQIQWRPSGIPLLRCGKKIHTGLVTVHSTWVDVNGSYLSAQTIRSGSGYMCRAKSYVQYTGATCSGSGHRWDWQIIVFVNCITHNTILITHFCDHDNKYSHFINKDSDKTDSQFTWTNLLGPTRSPWLYIHCLKTTLMLHTNFSAHQPILVIFGKMLLREYAIV